MRSHKGVIRICLTANPAAFPDCSKDKTAIARTVPATAPSVRIEGLTRGTYAIALIHDENANAKLDTLAGIPREGVGFSRNPRLMFGPPRFTAAGFPVAEAPVAQTVRMKYFL